MPLTVKDLKPCTILSYDISRHGGQRYERDNEQVYIDPTTGEEIKTWDTKKATKDPKEFKEASGLQAKAKRELGKLGAHSPLGVVLRRDRREEAEKVALEWEEKIAEFNSRAKHTTIDSWVMVFDIEGRNVVQLEKVIDKMFDVLGDLKDALASADPANIREVLKRIAGFTDILPEAAADAFQQAVDNARKKANEISKYDKRSARIAAKIEEEVNGQNPEEVLAAKKRELEETLRAKDYMERRKAPELKKSVFVLNKLLEDQEQTVQKLEESRATINRSAVERARFAVMRQQPHMNDNDKDNSAALQGAQQASRFAAIGKASSLSSDDAS